jgi:glycosyltransferase involved in cell wall biosynthesis
VTPYYEDAWAYGGIPRVVPVLARGLAAQGHGVTVCTTDACDRLSRLHRPGVAEPDDAMPRVLVFPNLSNRAAHDLQLFLPRGLGAYLRRHAASYDIAHLHACRNALVVVAARQLRRRCVPYVVSPHGTAPNIERRRAVKWIFDLTLGRGLLPGAARVLAVSEAERRQLLALGVPASAVAVIANPLPGELSREAPVSDAAARRVFWRRRWGFADGPVVLYLGRLSPRKRVDDLVRAFSQLASPSSRLVIAGPDMGVEASLRRLVSRLGLGERVVLTGLLRGAERLEALSAADLMVSPAELEVFGLAPLEALRCGTPVVVASDSGCGEIVSRVGGGAAVPPGDVAALAAAMGDLLRDGERARQAAAEASRRLREWLDPGVIVDRLGELYREVCDEAAARSAA